MLLHKLGHIDTHQRLFGVEQKLSQRLAQFSFTDPGWTKEEERTTWPIRVGQPGAGAPHRVSHSDYGFVLTDHPLMQQPFHLQQLIALTFEHLAYRNTGPFRHHFGDFFLGDLATQQLVLAFTVLIDHLQAALQVRNNPVLQLGHAVEITLAPRRLKLLPSLLDLLLDLRGALHLSLLRLPDFLQISVFTLQPRNVFVKLGQALDRRFVVFFLQRLGFNLELNQPPLKAVEHLRLGIDFHTNAAGRFVDQVDGLVR